MEPESLDAAAHSLKIFGREGRLARLRPVTRADHGFLFRLTTGDIGGARWRFRGAVPREEHFERLIWENVLTQFVVQTRRDNIDVGLVCAYGFNPTSGTVKAGATLLPEVIGRGLGIEAVYLLAKNLFFTYRIHKIYFETPEFNCSQFGAVIGRYMHIEGRLKDDEFYGGRRWDSYIFAMYKEDVIRFGEDHRLMLARAGQEDGMLLEKWAPPSEGSYLPRSDTE